MKSHVRVAVIGGGVVGCSVLYHLVKHGWKDVVLLERSELTSGSTWHAAGGMHTFNSDPNVAKLQDYTLKIYKEIEEVSGQSCGIHLTGGLMLADTQDRLDYLETARGRGRYLGLDTEFIDLQEAARMLPIMDPKHYVGVLYDPNEGHIDPSGVTHAYAGAARKGGAEVYRETRVTDLEPARRRHLGRGHGEGHPARGARGERGRAVGARGRTDGGRRPSRSRRWSTSTSSPTRCPRSRSPSREMLHVIDFGGELYMRQEGRGVLVGTYEKHGQPWSERTTPWDFGHELLPDDLDRIGDNLMRAFERFPALEKAGLKQIINGPLHLHPGRQPPGGTGAGGAELLGRVRRAGGLQPGGRRRPRARPLDDRRRSGHGHLGDGRRPVRRLRGARVLAGDGPPDLCHPLPGAVSQRGASGRPAAAPHSHPRSPEGEGGRCSAPRSVWSRPCGTRRRAPKPVEDPDPSAVPTRTGRSARSAARCARASASPRPRASASTRSPDPARSCGSAGCSPTASPREGRMVLSPMLNPRGTLIGDFTLAKLGPERFLILGSGPCRGLPHALVPAADARGRRAPAQPADRSHGSEHRGAEGARAALAGDRRRT